MVNADFLARAGLLSSDLVYWYAFSQSNPVGGQDVAMNMPVRKGAAAIAMIGTGACWVNLDGQAQPASGSPPAFSVQGNWTPIIGLELESDLTVHFTATAVGIFLTVVVFRRRRQLERLPGQE